MDLGYSYKNKSKRFPWATLSLLILNILVFIKTFHFGIRDIGLRWGFIPEQYDWFTVLSCMFVHASIGHLAGNMYYLWLFGRDVEGVCGTWLFLVLYVVAHVIGIGVYSLTISEAGLTIPLVGASFAISGVLGLYIIFFPHAKIKSISASIGLASPMYSQRAFLFIGIWFIYQLYMASLALKHQYSIGYWGHVGGFLFGVGIGYWLKNNYFHREDFLLEQEKAFEYEETRLEEKDKKIEQSLISQEHMKEEMVKKVQDVLDKQGFVNGVEEYKRLKNIPVSVVLAPTDQKKIADELFHKDDYFNALQAYLKFLNQYPNHMLVSEVSCRVGHILSNIKGDEFSAIHYLIAGTINKALPQNVLDESQQSLERIRLKIKDLQKSVVPLSRSGQYSVLLLCLDKGMIDIQIIRKAFSEVGMVDGINLGQKLCIIAEEKSGINDGIILDRLNFNEARLAREKLTNKGADVIILPTGDHIGYPIYSLMTGEKRDDAFIMRSEEGKEHHFSKKNIVHSAFAEFYYKEYGPANEEKDQFFDTAQDPRSSIAMGMNAEVPVYQLNNIGMNSVLDIFSADLKHYRISSKNFIYEHTAMDDVNQDHFSAFVKDFIRIVGYEKVDFNTKLFAANSTFSGLTYKSVSEFEKRSFLVAQYKFYY